MDLEKDPWGKLIFALAMQRLCLRLPGLIFGGVVMFNFLVMFIKVVLLVYVIYQVLFNLFCFFRFYNRKKSFLNNILDIKFTKIVDFIKYKIWDFKHYDKDTFPEYGMTIFCGRQGDGKTTGMVEYLERMRMKYPKCLVITNFGYKHEHHSMTSWRDFFKYRNGKYGVIFAIDEFQNEYNSNDYKNFPEELLRQITQQRKQKIKIVATSQVFTRVVKQVREQCYEVVECKTLAGRWTFLKCFDADDYNMVIDDIEKKNRLRRKWRRNFVQTNALRDTFSSYDIVKKLEKMKFLDRKDRG